jgi:DNA-binding transcriptional ArsR family regulator
MSLDETYRALSHPTRRELVSQVAVAPRRITDVAMRFPISLAAVSKHIRVLEGAGLVRREVCGREHVLSLDPAPLSSAAAWLSAYRQFWEERLDVLESRLREPRER